MNSKADITKALFQEGIQFFKSKKYKNAIAKWEQVLQYYPNHAQTKQWIDRARMEIAKEVSIKELVQKGKEYFAANKLQQAIDEWQKILDIQPDNLEANNLLAEAKSRLETIQTKPVQVAQQEVSQTPDQVTQTPTQPEVSEVPPLPKQDGKEEKEELIEEKILKQGLTLMYTKDYFPALQKFAEVLERKPKHTEALLYVETLKGTLEADGILDEWLDECEQLINNNQVENARNKLQLIAMADPTNKKVQKLLNSILLRTSSDKSVDKETHIKHLLARSLQLYEEKNTDAAIEIWEEILRIDPTNPQAKKYIETAKVELQRKNTDEIVGKRFKEAVRYHQEGDVRKALSKIEAVLSISPEHMGALKMKRELQTTLKRKDSLGMDTTSARISVQPRTTPSRMLPLVLVILTVILVAGVVGFIVHMKIQQKKSTEMLEKGKTLLTTGKLDEGLSIIRNAILVNDKNVEAYKVLGNYYFDNKDFSKATEQFKQVKQLGAAGKEELLKLNQSLYHTHHYNVALTGFQEMLKNYPNSAEVFKGIGLIYLEIGKYPDAIEDFQKAMKINPSDPYTLLYLGDAYQYNKKLKKAVLTYKKGISKNNKFTDYYLRLGKLYYTQGYVDKAIETLTKPLGRTSEKYKLYFSLGKIYKNEKKFDDAVMSFTKALHDLPENDPLIPKVYFEKSVAFLGMATNDGVSRNESKKLLSQAKSDLEKARDLTPDNFLLTEEYAPYYFYMGEIYLYLDNLMKAKLEYNLALQQKEDYAEAYARLGRIYFSMREKTKAIKNLEKALDLDPNLPDAADIKRMLREMGQ